MKTKIRWKLPNTEKVCWTCEKITSWKFQEATQESICTKCGTTISKIQTRSNPK